MPEIKIKRAQKENCTRILQLIKELAQYEKAPDKVTVSLSHFEESGFGEKPVWWGYIAEIDEHIAGFALYYIRYSTWKGQRMYLEDIYIEPKLRRLGIGTLLFEKLIEECKQLKLNGMVWQVLEWNELAINFYKKYKAGFDNEWVNCSLDFSY